MSPPRYRIVIEGELGPRYAFAFAFAFDGMTVRAHDGETEITGPIVDQSHLHGPIARIAGLLRLYSVSPTHSKPRTPRLTRSRAHDQPLDDLDRGTISKGS